MICTYRRKKINTLVNYHPPPSPTLCTDLGNNARNTFFAISSFLSWCNFSTFVNSIFQILSKFVRGVTCDRGRARCLARGSVWCPSTHPPTPAYRFRFLHFFFYWLFLDPIHTFSFPEYWIVWWFRSCKLYVFWQYIKLATSTGLFWPSTMNYQQVPLNTDPVLDS